MPSMSDHLAAHTTDHHRLTVHGTVGNSHQRGYPSHHDSVHWQAKYDCLAVPPVSWKYTHPVNMGIPGFPFLRDYRNPLQYGNGWWHKWRIQFWWIQSVSGKEWPSVKWPIQVVQSCTWTDGRFVIEREGRRIVKSCTLTECSKTSKWNYDKLTEQRKGIIASILNASVYFLT